ncbi:MAG: PD-(D/E)XK nuclease family protein [Elusimicrobia bacterium]|nr:PD-(D/E)XK nuclease family protein [Elusimicrobiota bacterium]
MMRHLSFAALSLNLALAGALPASAIELTWGGVKPMVEGTSALKLEAGARLPGPGLRLEPSIVPLESLAPEAALLRVLPSANESLIGTRADDSAVLPSLESSVGRIELTTASQDPAAGSIEGAQSYDGLKTHGSVESGDGGRVLEPAFEPPSFHTPPPGGGDRGGNGGKGGGGNDDGTGGETPRRPALSFSNPAAKTALLAVDPTKAIYGAIKRLRGDGSKDYWGVYKKDVEIDVVIRGENVLGRTTPITTAFNKPIGSLNRDDLKGTVPDYQLKAPIKQLRQMFIDRLEEDRKVWHANDEPVSAKTLVRVIKFKSYIDLYRETHGKDATPEPIKEREPLAVKPEGALKPLSIFLPRAVFLDMDLFDGPVSKEFLGDMIKLQRTGVYFVAFSRKPYASAGSIREKLIRQMSSYQLSILMPIRFMAVTDNGAVVSAFPKGGSVTPRDVLGFSDASMDILRDSAQKASEEVGIAPKAAVEAAQPQIREAADEFPGLTRREGSSRKDPQVRFQIDFAKGVTRAQAGIWAAKFESRLKSQAIEAKVALSELPEGRFSVSVQRTDLAGSLDRLKDALGKEFGLYLNPSDILVLSNAPALKAANPGLDFAGLSGLKGAQMADNALGLMLGAHRDNHEGDRAGSASRISSFRRDRQQYMTEILIKEDKAEQNINFFSGHVVHSSNDWLVHQIQNGKRPTEAEYRANLQERWDAGTREFKAIGMPDGETVDGMLRESTQRGVSMYKMILAAADRGEIIIGTEIPNFFMLNKYQKRTEALKGRYILHTIFDFIALRPDPKNPGRATVVIYDFKTGPAQSRQKLDKDIQVQIYTYFARHKWVGQDFPAPYLSGKQSYRIDNVAVEFIYNAVKQATTVTNQDMDKTRATIIRTLDRIAKTEAQLLGEIAPKPAKTAKQKAAAKKRAAAAKKARAAKAAAAATASKKKST